MLPTEKIQYLLNNTIIENSKKNEIFKMYESEDEAVNAFYAITSGFLVILHDF